MSERARERGFSAKTHKRMGNKQERIPEGKGPYSVGCTDLMTGPGIQGSFLRLYYPSRNDTKADAIWIPKKEYYYGICDFLNMYRSVGVFVLSRYFGSVTCPAKWDAAFKPGERYPLIIFSHGLGAFRTLYSAICIEMASRGFVVAAVEHRDQSASATYYYNEKPSSEANGAAAELQEEWMYYRKSKANDDDDAPFRRRQVQQRADECSRALDLLLGINSGKQTENLLPGNFDWTPVKDSIDIHRIAVMGHSFGAATAIETLSKDVRFKCAVALDAWMLPLSNEVYTRVHQPLFFINSETFQWVSNILEMKKLTSANRETKMITIKGSVHQSFPDFTFLTGNIVGKIVKLRGDLDPNVAIDISNEASLAFLQKHLGLKKGFDQWDQLVEGEGPNVIPGTNVELPPSKQ